MDQISLLNILEAFNSAINEEQAWAVCYQCVKYLKTEWTERPEQCVPLTGLDSLLLSKEGNCSVAPTDSEPATSEHELVASVGVLLFQALDYGLLEEEEHQLAPPLEALIDRMTGAGAAPEGEDEGIEEDGAGTGLALTDVLAVCRLHLSSAAPTATEAAHYRAVVRALVTEAGELLTFLDKISANKAAGGGGVVRCASSEDEDSTVDDLKRHDWARLWIQVMRDLRKGVKLKKVTTVTSAAATSSPSEFELTPYEVLMEDIRTRRYTLKQVPANGDIPSEVKKTAHERILEFIRSRPPLQPVSSRPLRAAPPRPVDPREALMRDIKTQEHRLKPTPGAATRSKSPGRAEGEDETSSAVAKKVIKPNIKLFDSDEDSDAITSDEDSEDEDKNKVTPSPLSPLTPLSPQVTAGWTRQDTADSEADVFEPAAPPVSTATVSTTTVSAATAMVAAAASAITSRAAAAAKPGDDTQKKRNSAQSPALQVLSSPDLGIKGGNILGPHGPHGPLAGFSKLRHDDPNDIPRSLQSSLECLSLTIEEVMHIRSVLTKAELECLLIKPDLHDLVAKGKMCFTCKKTRFSLFGSWATKCKFCKRNICAKCVSKMRIPTEHFENIPVYTLSPSPLSPTATENVFVYEKNGSAPSTPTSKETSSASFLPEFLAQAAASSGVSLGGRFKSPETTVTTTAATQTKPTASGDSSQSRRGRSGRRRGSLGDDSPPASRRKKLQRSQTTVRGERPTPPGPAKHSLQGPLMDICRDCKSMIVNIIRASRMSLALAPADTRPRLPDLPSQRGAASASRSRMTLNLKPVYK